MLNLKYNQETKNGELASIIIVTYNHLGYIGACLNSLLTQDYPHEIILVDNCSRDGTVDYVRTNFPMVKIIGSQDNRGYGAGNNLGVKSAQGKYIVILNPDTVAEEGWLRELILPLHQDKIITTPKILTYDGKHLNTCGNITHFTGLTFTAGYGIDPHFLADNPEFNGISGACFALKRKDYLKLGGFDENFFLYYEDTDFSWHSFCQGYTVLLVQRSVIRHDYVLSVSPEKLYNVELGRYLILNKYYSRRDFFLLAPSLVMTEVLTLGYALRLGYQGVKWKVKAIRDSRRIKVKPVRGDTLSLFRNLGVTIPVEQLSLNNADISVKRFANWIFKINYGAVR